MMTKLLPEQISKFWDIIKYAIEQSTPPIIGEAPNKMNSILMSALSGDIDVWASYDKEEEKTKFNGIILTELLYDKPSKTRNLLIYCLYGYENVNKDSWKYGILAILKYAKAKGCNQVIAYTDVPYMIEMTKFLGGEAKYTFCAFDTSRCLNNLINLMET